MLEDNMRSKEKVWINHGIGEEEIGRIARESGISDFLAKILLSRGMDNADKIKKFIKPSISDIYDPFLLEDMEIAVKRIKRAISDNEKTVVYGDYDVDGITSTSVLINFLSRFFPNVDYYIPDRIHEGYGLSFGAIDKIRQTGASLIISVDCGITAIEEVKYINECGIDIIITDHHECKDVLPDAYAVISPCRPDTAYPYKELAGVGVVYKLVTALCMEMGLGETYNEYLDLVTLGTIADVVPLLDENRAIVKYGLPYVEKTHNIGLRVLMENCGLKDKVITSWVVSFVLAPRINAAGRVGNAGRAVQLLTTSDRDKALEIVTQLSEDNRFRQETEQEIFQQAVNIIENKPDMIKDKVLVIEGQGWHQGVIGIVASRITERYYRPCILISYQDGMGKGSGRSVEGFDLFKALNHCGDLLDKYGGHELAAGLSLAMDKAALFKERINSYAESVLGGQDLLPKIKIDVHINKDDISMSNIKELEMLAPFGAANPGPVFEYDCLRINDIRNVGDGKHIKLLLEDNGLYVDAIGFGMGCMLDCYNKSEFIDVACTLEINSWNSIEKIQLNLKDMRHNREMVMEDVFFYSLDKCLKRDFLYNLLNHKHVKYTKNEVFDEDIMIHEILTEAESGKRIAVLVNSLDGAKNIEKKLRKYTTGIKKPYIICYTSFKHIDGQKDNHKYGENIFVVINPNTDEIELSALDRVIFYGDWINPLYLNSLLNKAERSKILFIESKKDKVIEYGNIVPDRKDLVAVYQYIKANCKDRTMEDNIFKLAKKISGSYKINMNYFKLKKCIEIFEELMLLKKTYINESNIVVEVKETGREKTNIEKSLLYRSLQALKVI
ncbi:MAG: single-stranded-DNA-specific exonuclease RecJ [Clostridia bacterium]|nr:single-stranded-DNA-specific exonuclease RecJ [Clostridia bacterium]